MRSPIRKKMRRFEPKYQYLTPDLWHEILARLPVKTLLRFRCVCKSWCSIIDFPDFTYMHRRLYNNKYNHPKNNTLLSCAEVTPDRMTCKFTLRRSTINTFRKKIAVQLCELKTSNYLSVLGSCHGLWLIEQKCSGQTGQRVRRRVLNPFIRKSIEIPSPPHKVNVTCVLGFAPSTNEYKVVSFSYDSKVSKVLISIYSLKNQKWIQRSPIIVSNWNSRNVVVFIEKAAYWFEGGPGKYDRTHLISFDFDLEQLSVCKLPDATENLVARFMFNLNDSLAVLSMSSETCRVWILEKDRDKASPWRLWRSADTNLDAYNLIIKYNLDLPSKILYLQNTDTFFIEVNLESVISYNMLSQQFGYVRKKFFGSIDTRVESLVSHKDAEWKDCDIHPVTVRKINRQKQNP